MAEIVAIVASLLSPALEVGKCFKKQFNYLFCIRTNIKDLTDAAKDLEDVQADLQDRVDGAERNGERILLQVETWITKADETLAIKHGIQTQIPGCLNLKSRYSLSRKAKKTAESMNELRDGCKFDRVSNPALPAAMGQAPPLRPTRGIGSRMKTEEDIIMALRDKEVYVIGVCGMGGVGKTTMAKQIMNRARVEEGLFDEVVLVPVGQQVDMLKIQHGIADWLKLPLAEETLAPRAIRLRARLEGGKRKLIVIDDVWEIINLEDLGIPCESGSCTILLTSRNESVVDHAQKVFTIQILSDEEAWSMFQENVGDCVDDSNLLPIAKEVAKECKGLPLALVAVSRALKGKEREPIWKDALKQLRSSNPMDIEDVIKKVYNPIKLSYDFLESPHAKSLLLLCSSFPEDWEISLEYLAFYGLGLGIFEGINNLEEARNRITGLVDMLKMRFLILYGEDEHHVKMHDVVRDVAIFIASKEKPILEFTSMGWSRQNPHTDCNMISVVKKYGESDFPKEIELLIDLTFPSLRFLWMHYGYRGLEEFQISDHFFKGMQQLKVLYMKSFSLGSTLQTMQLPKTLHTLHLEYCNLEGLSVVGELSSLEILICRWCNSIKELPVEIGRLNRLRLLEVSYCNNLKTIMAGVISRLGGLEELKILRSFRGWEWVEKGSNASLAELESLSNLRCLCIEIEDCSLAAQKLQLSSKIVKYNITVGKGPNWPDSDSYEKSLCLYLSMETLLTLEDGIKELARSADALTIRGDAYNTFDLASCNYTQNKKWLMLIDCRRVEKFVVSPVLEMLDLNSLPNLVEMCHGQIPSNNSFAKGNFFSITRCPKLRTLFSTSVVITILENLYISECESMEVVFSIEEEKDHATSPITFSKLTSLTLRNLKSLTTLCKGNHDDINIEFPRLVELNIRKCPKLTSFVNIASDQNHHLSSSHHHSLPMLRYKEVKFGSLEELVIEDCDNINNLFSYSIAANLVNLKKLAIKRCKKMEYVIADDNTTQTNPLIIFHKLEYLRLINLKSLTTLCKGNHDDINIEFPRLVELEIEHCPKLTSFINMNCASSSDSIHLFCSVKIKFASLKRLRIGGYKNMSYVWCRNIPYTFFGELEELGIGQCDNINNLISYSIAANLVNLKKLAIERCKEMEYVIADDNTTQTNPLIIFHKLEEVNLRGLPKLQSFCEGSWDLQFPSLKEVIVWDFPGMEGFTMGSISSKVEEFCFSN